MGGTEIYLRSSERLCFWGTDRKAELVQVNELSRNVELSLSLSRSS